MESLGVFWDREVSWTASLPIENNAPEGMWKQSLTAQNSLVHLNALCASLKRRRVDALDR